ncbi:MAG: 3-methyl-2-oxobutanoate dehydrogenase subunit beta, partial [Candidatus Aenigmarchaeota archaeon]|nr:3-methyl-2-oxobutanoate dehydrogenase subunit beta [Candidatus Aenigmarchaeota archaeon]
MRAGPGLGNIAGEQSDYFQVTKSGGHGGYHSIVLAPSSVQEMYDFTIKAFDLADKYRMPVIVAADGYLGQMKEAIVMSTPEIKEYNKSEWATTGAKNRGPHVITSIEIEHDAMELHRYKLVKLYKKVVENEILFEEYKTEDAEVVFVAYGIVSRIVKDVVNWAREKGLKVGLIRPKTLWPFPSDKITELAVKVKSLFVVELSPGQMVEDVERATKGKCPVQFYGRCGGNMPSKNEIFEKLKTGALK